MGCIDIRIGAGAISIGEEFPEAGLVKPKHVAICDFNDILK
jgi:hypothetical protein